jgi:hypothetical protein
MDEFLVGVTPVGVRIGGGWDGVSVENAEVELKPLLELIQPSSRALYGHPLLDRAVAGLRLVERERLRAKAQLQRTLSVGRGAGTEAAAAGEAAGALGEELAADAEIDAKMATAFVPSAGAAGASRPRRRDSGRNEYSGRSGSGAYSGPGGVFNENGIPASVYGAIREAGSKAAFVGLSEALHACTLDLLAQAASRQQTQGARTANSTAAAASGISSGNGVSGGSDSGSMEAGAAADTPSLSSVASPSPATADFESAALLEGVYPAPAHGGFFPKELVDGFAILLLAQERYVVTLPSLKRTLEGAKQLIRSHLNFNEVSLFGRVAGAVNRPFSRRISASLLRECALRVIDLHEQAFRQAARLEFERTRIQPGKRGHGVGSEACDGSLAPSLMTATAGYGIPLAISNRVTADWSSDSMIRLLHAFMSLQRPRDRLPEMVLAGELMADVLLRQVGVDVPWRHAYSATGSGWHPAAVASANPSHRKDKGDKGGQPSPVPVSATVSLSPKDASAASPASLSAARNSDLFVWESLDKSKLPPIDRLGRISLLFSRLGLQSEHPFWKALGRLLSYVGHIVQKESERSLKRTVQTFDAALSAAATGLTDGRQPAHLPPLPTNKEFLAWLAVQDSRRFGAEPRASLSARDTNALAEAAAFYENEMCMGVLRVYPPSAIAECFTALAGTHSAVIPPHRANSLVNSARLLVWLVGLDKLDSDHLVILSRALASPDLGAYLTKPVGDYIAPPSTPPDSQAASIGSMSAAAAGTASCIRAAGVSLQLSASATEWAMINTAIAEDLARRLTPEPEAEAPAAAPSATVSQLQYHQQQYEMFRIQQGFSAPMPVLHAIAVHEALAHARVNHPVLHRAMQDAFIQRWESEPLAPFNLVTAAGVSALMQSLTWVGAGTYRLYEYIVQAVVEGAARESHSDRQNRGDHRAFAGQQSGTAFFANHASTQSIDGRSARPILHEADSPSAAVIDFGDRSVGPMGDALLSSPNARFLRERRERYQNDGVTEAGGLAGRKDSFYTFCFIDEQGEESGYCIHRLRQNLWSSVHWSKLMHSILSSGVDPAVISRFVEFVTHHLYAGIWMRLTEEVEIESGKPSLLSAFNTSKKKHVAASSSHSPSSPKRTVLVPCKPFDDVRLHPTSIVLSGEPFLVPGMHDATDAKVALAGGKMPDNASSSSMQPSSSAREKRYTTPQLSPARSFATALWCVLASKNAYKSPEARRFLLAMVSYFNSIPQPLLEQLLSESERRLFQQVALEINAYNCNMESASRAQVVKNYAASCRPDLDPAALVPLTASAAISKCKSFNSETSDVFDSALVTDAYLASLPSVVRSGIELMLQVKDADDSFSPFLKPMHGSFRKMFHLAARRGAPSPPTRARLHYEVLTTLQQITAEAGWTSPLVNHVTAWGAQTDFALGPTDSTLCIALMTHLPLRYNKVDCARQTSILFRDTRISKVAEETVSDSAGGSLEHVSHGDRIEKAVQDEWIDQKLLLSGPRLLPKFQTMADMFHCSGRTWSVVEIPYWEWNALSANSDKYSSVKNRKKAYLLKKLIATGRFPLSGASAMGKAEQSPSKSATHSTPSKSPL